MAALDGASVVVLGASGGLGREITALAAARGAKLTLAARDGARLADLAGTSGALAVTADLRDPTAAGHVLEAAIEAHGGVDVVVNATGVVAFGPVEELDIDVLEELFLTNAFIPFFAARAALAVMNQGGTIVNISGVIAEQNLPGMAAYGASKAAVASLSTALAREARRKKITVLDARPGHTETGLADRAIAGEAPKFPEGLAPSHVAKVIVDAIENGTKDLPSSAF